MLTLFPETRSEWTKLYMLYIIYYQTPRYQKHMLNLWPWDLGAGFMETTGCCGVLIFCPSTVALIHCLHYLQPHRIYDLMWYRCEKCLSISRSSVSLFPTSIRRITLPRSVMPQPRSTSIASLRPSMSSRRSGTVDLNRHQEARCSLVQIATAWVHPARHSATALAA